MEKELLKALIEEIGAAALEAVSGMKFATLAVKLTVKIMTRDVVLDKLVNLFGVDPAAFMAGVKSRFAAKPPVVVTGPELTLKALEVEFEAACKA